MARKTKRDWFVTAVKILRQSGPQGLTIDALCQSLAMTKGSFYHHFGSYDDFKAQFLSFYEQEGTLDIISQLANLPSPKEKLHRLLEIVVEFSTKLPDDPDVAMRAWALQDTAVAQTQARVDGRRRHYVQSLCQEITGDAEQAKELRLRAQGIKERERMACNIICIANLFIRTCVKHMEFVIWRIN